MQVVFCIRYLYFFEIVHSPTFEIAERCGNEEDSNWY